MFKVNKILHCMIKNMLGTIYGLTFFLKLSFQAFEKCKNVLVNI
jgi:hypothetical protein